MDDLSFEEFETDYKYLKAVMEGGIESKPENVLFYATSNRRHLVREKWQDRESEVHKNDILNEKLSLSERFGLTLMYNNPSQAEYLTIVEELAAQAGLKLKKESLSRKALQWSKWNNGRSGRSARQFINQLLKEDRK
jgi:predicted AAA+ superfamily ATPase